MKTEKGKTRQIQVSESTAKKIDKLKANFWLKNSQKPNTDLIIDYLAELELTKLGLNDKNE